LYTFTGRRHEENTQPEALPNPQLGTENEHENKLFGSSDTVEDPNNNFTGVEVEEINGESMEQLIKE
jgi:hypothetical protein